MAKKTKREQVIELLKGARAQVKKPFGWGKCAYQRTAVIKVASTERDIVDIRGVEVPAGEKGLFVFYADDADKGNEQVNCVCAIGALQAIVGEARLEPGPQGRVYQSAVKALESALPKSYKPCDDAPSVEEFNDMRTTTQNQVVALFNRAIKSLETA